MTAAAVVGSSWVIFFAILTLLYCAATVSYLIWKGNPQNSLHASALSWCFLTGLVVLGGVGFGQMIPSIQQIAQVMATVK